MQKLTSKDIKTLKLGGVCAAAIFVFFVGSKWRDSWLAARRKGAEVRAQLELIDAGKIKEEGLRSIVPAFEMPQAEEAQKSLFRNRVNEQLKKAGIQNPPFLQYLSGTKSRGSGYKALRLKCSAKCGFSQMLDLLAGLNDNPYLVGVEELKMVSDQKNPQEVQFDLTLSTFVK
jgi:hypothetical protein